MFKLKILNLKIIQTLQKQAQKLSNFKEYVIVYVLKELLLKLNTFNI